MALLNGHYPPSVLAWMDLEMTGLDTDRHVIVEISTILTNDDLTILAEGPDLVVHATEVELAQMDDFVTEMHTSSGLLNEIKTSTLSLEEAAGMTLDFLRLHINEEGTIPLCGNSIGTDRRFLARYLPELERFFHYRSVDVSTIKELARRWYPEQLDGLVNKQGSHRALDDIRESIAELQAYRSAFFVAQGEGKSSPTD